MPYHQKVMQFEEFNYKVQFLIKEIFYMFKIDKMAILIMMKSIETNTLFYRKTFRVNFLSCVQNVNFVILQRRLWENLFL